MQLASRTNPSHAASADYYCRPHRPISPTRPRRADRTPDTNWTCTRTAWYGAPVIFAFVCVARRQQHEENKSFYFSINCRCRLIYICHGFNYVGLCDFSQTPHSNIHKVPAMLMMMVMVFGRESYRLHLRFFGQQCFVADDMMFILQNGCLENLTPVQCVHVCVDSHLTQW